MNGAAASDFDWSRHLGPDETLRWSGAPTTNAGFLRDLVRPWAPWAVLMIFAIIYIYYGSEYNFIIWLISIYIILQIASFAFVDMALQPFSVLYFRARRYTITDERVIVRSKINKRRERWLPILPETHVYMSDSSAGRISITNGKLKRWSLERAVLEFDGLSPKDTFAANTALRSAFIERAAKASAARDSTPRDDGTGRQPS